MYPLSRLCLARLLSRRCLTSLLLASRCLTHFAAWGLTSFSTRHPAGFPRLAAAALGDFASFRSLSSLLALSTLGLLDPLLALYALGSLCPFLTRSTCWSLCRVPTCNPLLALRAVFSLCSLSCPVAIGLASGSLSATPLIDTAFSTQFPTALADRPGGATVLLGDLLLSAQTLLFATLTTFAYCASTVVNPLLTIDACAAFPACVSVDATRAQIVVMVAATALYMTACLAVLLARKVIAIYTVQRAMAEMSIGTPVPVQVMATLGGGPASLVIAR